MYQNVKVVPDQNGNGKVDPLDEELKNGPLNKRECRDILCCLMFIAACASCIFFFAYGFKNGQPERLFSVYDKSGAACGLDEQSDRKYLFFYAPYKDYFSQTTCVAECPTATSQTTSNCNINSMTSKSCATNNCSSLKLAAGVDDQTVCYYATEKFLSKICLPTAESLKSFSSGAEDSMNSLLNSSTLTQWLNDISNSRKVIAGSIGIAFGLGFLYMIFLRFFAGLMVWIAIILYFAGIFVLGYLSYKKAKDIDDYLKANNNIESGSNTETNKKSYQYLAYILWAFGGLCFIGFMCMYQKIRQAIAIIKTTTQYISDVWTAMLVPPAFTILVAAWWLMWLIGYIYLYAIDESGKIHKSSSSMFASVTHTSRDSKLLWAYLFVGLWINAFIQSLCQFVLASSACIWYFSHGQEGQKHAPIRTSLYRAFRYHLGSLAFGALLLAIVQFIRIILAYMEQQMKKAGANKNKVTQFLLKCMQCYMACFERFIKFLNRNAFIQIALKGQNFCVAAKDAMSLIWCNAARFALVNGIGSAFIFLGKLFITCATTFLCYLIISRMEPYKSDVVSYVLPCIIIFFIAYAISIIFMCVYGMGMSAILVCFLWDEKICQRGTPDHAPPLLQEFFDNNEKDKKN